MELIGIMLSVPVAFILGALCVGLLRKFVRPRERLRHALQVGSLVVVGMIVIEAALVLSLGAVWLRQTIGPPFYGVHVALLLIAVPALASVLALRPSKMSLLRVLLVAAVCALFALPVVLLQYAVSEDLFGVDGSSGPFGVGPGSRRAAINDMTGDRAQILTVDGRAVERATNKYLTAIPMALVAPGAHTFRVKLRAVEVGGPEDTTSVEATVTAGGRYRFKTVGTNAYLVPDSRES